MSRLITSGDTNLNFGKLLPAPYIEQIYLGTDTATGDGTIDVQINIYIRSNEYSDDDTLIHQLGDLRVVWMYAAPSSTELDELISGEKNIWAYELEVLANWGVPLAFQLSEISDDIEVIYDDEGNRVLKLTYLSSNTDIGDTLTLDSAWSEIEDDVYLFAWATFDLVDSAYWGSYDFSGDQIWEDRFGRFLTMETGGVAYEPVWVDEAAATTEEVIWVDEDGNTYDGTPLQSVSSQYYSVNRVTHADIVSSFQDILDAYESLAEDDEPLQDMLDQISYVLVTYGKEADLLPQLNLLRRVFPSKSSVTNVGQLFINYRDAIYNTNTVIEEGDLLSKKEILNTKVTDLRTTTLTGFSTDDTCFIGSDGTLGSYVTYKHSVISTISNLLIERTSFDYNTMDSAPERWFNEYYNNYGFFFFDYDKALYETSEISQYMDMSLLYDLFGTDMVVPYFQLAKVFLYRKQGTADFDDETLDENGDNFATHYYIMTNYEDGYKATDMEWVTQETYATYGVPYVEGTDFEGGDCYGVSFVLLRNFQLASEDGNGDYRMMCFEFQDLVQNPGIAAATVDEYLEDTANRLQFKVNIVDTTTEFLGDLVEAYTTAMAGLETYVNDVAGVDCVFSTTDGRWVDSFVEEMRAEYDDDLGNAPWNFYPIYYCLYKELFTREHDGSMTSVLAEASAIAARISPDYGTLDELKAFKKKFDALFTNYFGPDTDVGDLIGASPTIVYRQYYRMFNEDTYVTETYAYSSDEDAEGHICAQTAHSMTEFDLEVEDYTSLAPSYFYTGYWSTEDWQYWSDSSAADSAEAVYTSATDTGVMAGGNIKLTYDDFGSTEGYFDIDGNIVADGAVLPEGTFTLTRLLYERGSTWEVPDEALEQPPITVKYKQGTDKSWFLINPTGDLSHWNQNASLYPDVYIYKLTSNFDGKWTAYDGVTYYKLEEMTPQYFYVVDPDDYEGAGPVV